MDNLDKIARMASAAFSNALRLHRDSILLFNSGSIPSALQLSILAQEEIGKAFLLEEHIFQYLPGSEPTPPELEKLMIDALMNHGIKQRWFSRQADDYHKYRGNKLPKIIREVYEGKLEEIKQNSTYVGLTKLKASKKMNPKGRIISPMTRISSKDAATHITRVNDFVIELAERCTRGLGSVDTEDVSKLLTSDLVQDLEKRWPHKSAGTKKRLQEIRKFEME